MKSRSEIRDSFRGHGRSRKAWSLLVTIGIALSACLLQASPAAAVTLLNCTGSYSTTYDPGLTYDPQPVTYDTSSTYGQPGGLCLGGGAVKSGTSSLTDAQLPSASCVDLLGSTVTGETTVTWNTGETSRYTWSSTAADVLGTLVTTTTGTVVEGKYLGGSVQRISIAPNLQVLENACNSPQGLTSDSGTVTLTIQSA
ncbi:hypothetical protein ACIBKX_32845 [Streptomyces sp. NPDC050658]|uniref:hypothetical protein n=1 Tax=unclassified Streptomyces TaxID=2593676 RepID=UPI00343D3D15